MTSDEASVQFLKWLDRRVLDAGRGDSVFTSALEPNGQFWLGRLAPEKDAAAAGTSERGERLNPCAIGLRVLPALSFPLCFTAEVGFAIWAPAQDGGWRKLTPIRKAVPVVIEANFSGPLQFGAAELQSALTSINAPTGFSGRVQVEQGGSASGAKELIILFVNSSEPGDQDHNLYQCSLRLIGLETRPFILESLPDSFRYDRRISAYGINCGAVVETDGSIGTADSISVETERPSYWNVEAAPPDLRFEALGVSPVAPLRELVDAHRAWGSEAWSNERLARLASDDLWSSTMLAQAEASALEFEAEHQRLLQGLSLLESDGLLRRAFQHMNQAMLIASRGRYDSWRPFQAGFLLANLRSVIDKSDEPETIDIVWFATGGGKTETYLGLLLVAALFDRLSGKVSGVTAWSRFPLRMLSLQQTQRFADALAGAEVVRRREDIAGDPFSVGFLVGKDATPNTIAEEPSEADPDPDDDEMPRRYKVLLKCPFCGGDTITMRFNRATWRLEHCCSAETCIWPEEALPFYVVDDEIFRFLPTLIVGTLDKAASIAWQTGMRALVGSPIALCSERGHGYSYAPRSKRKTGCLVPGCRGKRIALPMPSTVYAPTFRLQDELHLLRDSLGAVDSHYESLLDHLQMVLSGRRPKILASSATLNGYQRQSRVLYQRDARIFPADSPAKGRGFWTSDSGSLLRRFNAVAPRGLTIEYAVIRTLSELQAGVRSLLDNPASVAESAGFEPEHAPGLISRYGVQVLYGNTIRDLDAAQRSFETQLPISGRVNTAALTGKTAFDEVRQILDRLAVPEERFEDRIHLLTASSMMSHGVDIDRLNIMIMLGLPLTAAEFIQTTARVGRRWPGMVYVMHKMARERDAGVFGCFEKFVTQGDRFVEAIAITRRSRRILEKTAAAIALSRIITIHEPLADTALTTVSALRAYLGTGRYKFDEEFAAAEQALRLTGDVDEPLRLQLRSWFERYFSNLSSPAGTVQYPSDLSPTGSPMRSLRDVEEQAPVFGIGVIPA
jgi:hypothetical protein